MLIICFKLLTRNAVFHALNDQLATEKIESKYNLIDESNA